MPARRVPSYFRRQLPPTDPPTQAVRLCLIVLGWVQFTPDFRKNIISIETEDKTVDVIMDTKKRVLVNPDRAARCGWCGSYESVKWRNDFFRSSIWCSHRCYMAGHFWEFVFYTVAILVIDLALINVQLVFAFPLTLQTVLMFSFLFSLTGLIVIASYVGYSQRSRLSRRVN
jgi:hypothetical protein